jgi:hypothetical protein
MKLATFWGKNSPNFRYYKIKKTTHDQKKKKKKNRYLLLFNIREVCVNFRGPNENG